MHSFNQPFSAVVTDVSELDRGHACLIVEMQSGRSAWPGDTVDLYAGNRKIARFQLDEVGIKLERGGDEQATLLRLVCPSEAARVARPGQIVRLAGNQGS